MLAVFENGEETIICSVNDDGQPNTEGYFSDDGRDREDYNFSLVEPPICVAAALRLSVARELLPA